MFSAQNWEINRFLLKISAPEGRVLNVSSSSASSTTTSAAPAASLVNSSTAVATAAAAAAAVGLDEYVDILSVQQLLLDSPAASNANGNKAARPRLNVQKAAEYAASNQGTRIYHLIHEL